MRRFGSIRTLNLLHGFAFLALVAITAVAGTVALVLRHEASEESLRLNRLLATVQETRGDLYRQMKELFDHHFLEDPEARRQYAEFGAKLTNSFMTLETLAETETERSAVAKLERAYERVRADTDALMERPPDTSSVEEAFEIFDVRLEGDRLSGYEAVFSANEELLAVAQQTIRERVERLTRTATAILLLPILLAAALLLIARSFLRRAFVEPMIALVRAVEKYRSGELNHRVTETGAEELVTLERAVNQMAVDLKESREALVRSEKQAALGALVPVIAHNIRNPLASIRATAQIAEEDGLPRETQESLEGIVATVDRLETWLASLLAYLDPTITTRTVTGLKTLTGSALSLLAHRLRDKSLSLEWDPRSSDCRVQMDRDLLEQAIYGLLVNAVDASPRGGRIRLSCRDVEGGVSLEIEDDGPGLGFTPDPRGLAPGPTTKIRGSGLGIPFAFRIVEMHDGILSFEDRPSGGTRVRIILPLLDRERSAA